jgi:formylglycine-generating enzyme required for sulfatase activity
MGAALYEMLAGKPPFDAVNDFRLYQKILNEKPLVLKGVPSALAELVYKSLEKEPDKRFSGCGEFLSYLEAYENKRLPPPIPEVKPVVLDNEPRVKVEPRQIPEAKPVAPVNQPKAKEKQIVNKKDGSLLVLVPAGEFEMGDGRDSDNPIHKLYLDDYYIGVYAVTNKQYEQFVKETGHRPPDHSDRSVTPPIWKGKSYPQEYADHPVVCVSWDDATEYCKWAGLWLPTEAQWEKAARGPKGYIYPWGNDWDKYNCRNYESSVGGTCRVNDYPLGVSGYGAYNMSGNVWEWCRDFYSADYYKSIDSYRDPIGPLRGASRVLRGGSWLSYGPDCRSAHRFRDGPGYRHGRYGLRACLPEVSAVR